MDDFRRVLERARDRIPTPDIPLEGVYRRRDRRRRNQRIAAGVLGIGLALLGLGIGYRIAASPEQPAHQGAPLGEQRLRTAVFGVDGSLRREIQGLPADAFGTQLSVDGSRVVFITKDASFASCSTCVDGLPRLATMAIDGSDPRTLVGRWKSMTSPSWSPDGSRIAFAASDGENTDIFVVDADGSNVLQITHDPAMDSYPSWSPDGTRIVFDNAGSESLDSADLSVTQEIFTVSATGGTPVRLTHDDVGEKQAVYSPDGSRIAVSRGDAGIWIMRADGTRLRRVRGIEGNLFSPRWSPDGTQIAFLTYLDDLRPFVLDPRFATVDRRRSLPLMQLGIIDMTNGELTTMGVLTASDVNAASWLPSGDALLIDRFTAS